MAQEQGFEPWHRVTDLQAFQACPFNHLGIPAKIFIAKDYNNNYSKKNKVDFVEIISDSN